jgi:hypothetical protein
MPLNKSTGNMYGFVTHTWNPVKGACPHACTYCYMNKINKRFGKTPAPPHLVESELNAVKTCGNTIFVCSSIDLFADAIPTEWIRRVLWFAEKNRLGNIFLFHTKNPTNTLLLPVSVNFILCATIESNRWHDEMGNAPAIYNRALGLKGYNGRKMITIEPIMDFDLKEFVTLIKACGNIEQVNIGADTGNNHLPEPPKEKVLELIAELEKFTKVVKKKNLAKLIAV